VDKRKQTSGKTKEGTKGKERTLITIWTGEIKAITHGKVEERPRKLKGRKEITKKKKRGGGRFEPGNKIER